MVVNIPFALLAAVIALWGAGQTINLMTLGGSRWRWASWSTKPRWQWRISTHNWPAADRRARRARGSGEVGVPRLLAMLSVVAVFVPSFFMAGDSRSLFAPLSLAVGFSMIASYLLSSTLVPVLSVWLLGKHHPSAPTAEAHKADWVRRDRLQGPHGTAASGSCALRGGSWSLSTRRSTIAVGVVLVGLRLGREIFPAGGVSQFQLRFRAPAGTKFESTERLATDVLDGIKRAAGREDNVEITLGYVGVQAVLVAD